MGQFSIAGTAKARGADKIDPRLVAIIQKAAASSPFDVQLFSGKRFGSSGGSRHNTGNAVDIVLVDPATGTEIPNLKSSAGYPIYAEFAKQAREVQQADYPDLANAFRWGGGFSGGKDKYGSVDLMHFDLKPGGSMGGFEGQNLAEQWNMEFTPAQAKIVASMGPGQIYSASGTKRAPGNVQYADMTGRARDLGAPETQVSMLPKMSGAPAVDNAPSALTGYAPNIPSASFPTDAVFAQAPVQGQGQTQNLIGGALNLPEDYASGRTMGGSPEPMPRVSPRQPSGAPGVADILMPRERPSYMPMVPGGGALGAERPEAGVPIPNLRPQRGESLTRPQDYISGDASQMTPEAMTADLYRSRADQMPNPRVRPPAGVAGIPTPPSNPRRDPNGFRIDPYRPSMTDADGMHTELTTTFDAAEVGRPGGIVTVPTVIEGVRVSPEEAKQLYAEGKNGPVQFGFPSFDEADQAAQARSASIEGARSTALGPPRLAPGPFPARPEFPGSLPAAVPPVMDAQGMAPADQAMSQTFPRSVQGSEYQFSETPEQAYDRMTREREEFNAAMEAGTLPQRPIYSPDFSIADPGDPSQSLVRPPTQGAVFDPSMARPPVPSDITTANSPFAAGIDSLTRYSPAFDFAAAPAGPTNFPPSMGAINAPPLMEGAARLPDLPSAPMTPNMAGRFDDAFSPSGPSFADFLNSGGASPAAASVPPMKDQSRLPEFGGPFNTGGYGQAPMPRLDPVINAVDPIQISPSSSLQPWDRTSIPQTAFSRVASGDKNFVPMTYGGEYDPVGATGEVTNDGADYPNIYAGTSSAQAMPVLPKPMSPPSISMDDFNSRFGSPGAVSSPVGWSVGMPVATAPTPSAAPPSAPSAPIDIRPPAAGGPPVSAPKFTPPPQIQPQQRERPIGNLLNTLVENVFGGGGPFAGNSFGSFATPWSGQSGGTSSSFTATQSGKTPSGQEWNKGTVGPNEWNGGQYTNSRGTAVTYAENPFGGGYMVGYG